MMSNRFDHLRVAGLNGGPALRLGKRVDGHVGTRVVEVQSHVRPVAALAPVETDLQTAMRIGNKAADAREATPYQVSDFQTQFAVLLCSA